MIRVYIYIYLDQTHYFFVTKRFPRLTMAVRGTPRINEIEQPRVERSFLHSSVKRTLKEFFFFPLFFLPLATYTQFDFGEKKEERSKGAFVTQFSPASRPMAGERNPINLFRTLSPFSFCRESFMETFNRETKYDLRRN